MFALLLQGTVMRVKCTECARTLHNVGILGFKYFTNVQGIFFMCIHILNKVPFGVGINESILNVLKCSIPKMTPKDKLGYITFHEMFIHPVVQYNMKSNFTDPVAIRLSLVSSPDRTRSGQYTSGLFPTHFRSNSDPIAISVLSSARMANCYASNLNCLHCFWWSFATRMQPVPFHQLINFSLRQYMSLVLGVAFH